MRKAKPFGRKKKRVAFTRMVKWYIREVDPYSDANNLFQTRIVIKFGPYKNSYMRVEERFWYQYMMNHVVNHLGFEYIGDVKVYNNAKYIELYQKIVPLDITDWKRVESILREYNEHEPESEEIKACFVILNQAFEPEVEEFVEDAWRAANIEIEATVFHPQQHDISIEERGKR